jgi:hypothetical protein
VQELEVRVSELETQLARLENAVGALLINPHNPVSAAAQARAALVK